MVILAVGQNPLLASAHSYKVLYTFGFSGQELSQPEGGLLLDKAGNLFGTTAGGGAYYKGGATLKK
jgi:hypothetical protein